jgi:hypothetical protein
LADIAIADMGAITIDGHTDEQYIIHVTSPLKLEVSNLTIPSMSELAIQFPDMPFVLVSAQLYVQPNDIR